jgi:hypothetical protein
MIGLLVGAPVAMGLALLLGWGFVAFRTSPETRTTDPATLPLDGPLLTDFKLQFSIDDAVKTDGVYHVSLEKPIIFRLELARDAFIHVWSVNSDGTVTQLFPNKKEPDAWVPAAESPRSIPSPAIKPNYFVLSPSTEDEHLFVVATTEKIKMPKGQQVGASPSSRRSWKSDR